MATVNCRPAAGGKLSSWAASWFLVLLIASYSGFRLRIVSQLCIASTVIAQLGTSVPLRSGWLNFDLIRNAVLVSRAPLSARTLTIFLSICCGAYPLFVLATQMAQTINGNQGVDFAIYAQILDRFAAFGRLETSLIDLRYQHFLTHHFSPYLYIFGWCTRLTGDAPLTLLAFHAAGIALTMLGLSRLLRTSGIPSSQIALYLTLLIVLPAPRVGLLWEVHDDVYALPLVVWALYALKQGRLPLLIALLTGLAAIKETMFLVISMLACVGATMHRDGFGPLSRRTSQIFFFSVFLTGLLGFILYTRILPGYLFQSTFDGFQRLCTLEQLVSPALVRAKFWWMLTIFLPVAPLLWSLYFPRSRQFSRLLIFLLPAAPGVAAVLVSNFRGMLEPYNYYAILPATLTLCAVILVCDTHRPSFRSLFLSLLVATMFGPRIKAPSQIRDALVTGSHQSSLNQLVPEDSVVVTSDYGASYFYAHRQMIRLYHANRNLVHFDYIAIRKGMPQRLSLYLRSWSEPFFENDQWLIRRALKSKSSAALRTH